MANLVFDYFVKGDQGIALGLDSEGRLIERKGPISGPHPTVEYPAGSSPDAALRTRIDAVRAEGYRSFAQATFDSRGRPKFHGDPPEPERDDGREHGISWQIETQSLDQTDTLAQTLDRLVEKLAGAGHSIRCNGRVMQLPGRGGAWRFGLSAEKVPGLIHAESGTGNGTVFPARDGHLPLLVLALIQRKLPGAATLTDATGAVVELKLDQEAPYFKISDVSPSELRDDLEALGLVISQSWGINHSGGGLF